MIQSAVQRLTDQVRGPHYDVPYAIDQVCNNCAYRETCATCPVENRQSPASLAVLGLEASILARLVEAGIDSLQQLSTLLHGRVTRIRLTIR